MKLRGFASVAVALSGALSLAPSYAQESPDEAATVAITRAMDQHYLGTRFDEAVDTLNAAIEACGQCSGETVAQLWMYLGMVHGSGRGDQESAREAFRRALERDPRVALDPRFVTGPTVESFREVGGQVEEKKTAADAAARACVPAGVDIQTRYPVPVSCRSGRQAGGMTLRYLPFRGDEWVTLEMKRVAGEFRAEIPCSATEHAGTLSYYVLIEDAAGDLLDAVGSKTQPLTIRVDPTAKSAPSGFAGSAAPGRCAAEEICPPDFPGCRSGDTGPGGARDWQEACESSSQCRQGLLCRRGRCEVAPNCDIDSDCSTGFCREGRCALPPGGLKAKPVERNHRLALLFALDVGFVGGRDVCSAADSDYECFERSSAIPYPGELDEDIAVSEGEPGDPYPGARLGQRAAVGTKRVLVDYGWSASNYVSLGGRVGFAFGGGPAAKGTPRFLPLHAEARAAYWPLGIAGFVRPRLGLSVGVAQVDLSGRITVLDCSESANRAAFEACIEGRETVDPDRLPEVELDAYRKLGRGFVALGGGLVVTAFGPSFAEVGLRAMYLLPEAGFVLEPSIGAGYAF